MDNATARKTGTRHHAQIGDVTRVIAVGNATIQRRVAWVAYPKNGNNHNPTITYAWDVVNAAGRMHIPSVPTLREAKQLAAEPEAQEAK